jgi:dephospho-CoA kinase
VARIGITGGIGAGKTALTDRLRSLGFLVIDADEIAREVTAPGAAAFQAIRDAFGDAVLAADGTLDRAFLADVVFHDVSALKRLNHITHAPIGAEITRRLADVEGSVFVALPLFRPEHRSAFALDEIWAVQVEPETAVSRLCSLRGFSEDDARSRLASQMSNDERASIVDRVLWNEASLDELYAQLDEALGAEGLVRG